MGQLCQSWMNNKSALFLEGGLAFLLFFDFPNVDYDDDDRAYSNLRQGSLTEAASSGADRGYSSGTSAGSLGGLTRPTSETNLRQLAYGDAIATSLAARPGSALGLLQGSSIVNANGLRSTINLTNAGARSNPAINVKSEDQTLRESLAAILPPDLRHLVGAPSTSAAITSTTNDSSTILSVVNDLLSMDFNWVSIGFQCLLISMDSIDRVEFVRLLWKI